MMRLLLINRSKGILIANDEKKTNSDTPCGLFCLGAGFLC